MCNSGTSHTCIQADVQQRHTTSAHKLLYNSGTPHLHTSCGTLLTHKHSASHKHSPHTDLDLQPKQLCPYLRSAPEYVFATGWTVRGSKPGDSEIFPHTPSPDLGTIQPHVQCVRGLSRGQNGRGMALTTPPRGEVRERVELYLYSPLCLRGLL